MAPEEGVEVGCREGGSEERRHLEGGQGCRFLAIDGAFASLEYPKHLRRSPVNAVCISHGFGPPGTVSGCELCDFPKLPSNCQHPLP